MGPDRQTENRTIQILNKIFPEPRRFAIRLWSGAVLPAHGDAAFTLVLRTPGTLRRMMAPPVERSMGEAYIYGDLDVEGDLLEATSLLDDVSRPAFDLPGMSGLLGRLLTLPRSNTGKAGGRGPAKLIGERHSSRRDQAAIQYHYDVSNDFYALWLDREMQYSCAYFITPSDSLETAQEQKMDLICRKLRLQEGERLLDIGCGWGGLARYAARTRGVSVLGITLSREQARFASEKAEEEGLSDRVAIQLRDYRDLAGEQFDKIVSIGMAEHVGQKRLLGYFQNAYGCLRPGGLFLNHAISFLPLVHGLPGGETAFGTYYGRRLKQGWLVEKVANWFLGPMSFTQAYFFPDGELIPVTVMDLAAEQAGFEVRDVENLREHYALTLRHWVQRMAAHQAEMEQAASGVTYRTWRIYMASSAYSFESGRIGLHQSLLAKPDQGRANLPLTRHDLYR